MNIDDILRQFPDSKDLRAHALLLKRQSLERWIGSTDSRQYRANRIEYMRGEILCLVADLRDFSDACQYNKPPDDNPLENVVVKLMETSRMHLIVEQNGLQAILDLLTAVDGLTVTDGISNAAANSWLATADKILEKSRLTIRFALATAGNWMASVLPLTWQCAARRTTAIPSTA